MASVGIEELQARTTEVLRRVREHGETIDVTDGGEVVARVVPAGKPRAEHAVDEAEAMQAWLRRADALAREIGTRWPKGVSAVDAVRDARRDL